MSESAAPRTTRRRSWTRRDPGTRIDWRFWSQTFWAAITIWIGWEFWRFVHHFETAAAGNAAGRPPGAESFLPISGLMGLRNWIASGVLNHIHPAATIVLGLALLSSVLLKKSFCGWVCPIGFLSEAVGTAGRKVHRWKGLLPRSLDRTLRSIKYLLLAFFVWAIWFAMPARELALFIESPYNRVADIKMLHFFTRADSTTIWILLSLVALGFVVSGFWCRFLCPYGALTGLVSFLAPWKITRRAASCIDCDKCNRACPAHIPVAQLYRVRSDECNGCLACVAVCPSAEALELSLPRSRARLTARSMMIAVTALFVIGIGLAMTTGHWQNNITTDEYTRRIHEIDNPKYSHNRGQVPVYTPSD
ncbi:MAG: 4Fe-4S binding protein [candidate division Zixibacteria bacterium]|nr:4Fe-4S binding protein [candidate division Zixibacteria bacterium]